VPFATFFFVVAARLVPDPRSRRAVALMPVVLAGYLVAVNAWTVRTPECWRTSDGLWNRGVCLQSTDYTCGAASIATLVRAKGGETTEHEAARLSLTIPSAASPTSGRAGAQAAPSGTAGLDPRVALEDAAKLPLPCLAPLKWSFWFDHMVVVLAPTEDGLLIGEPLRGPVRMTRANLAPLWRGTAVTAE